MATIVMTGGTSGLGQVAANRLLATPGTRLLLGARRPGPPAAETIPLDLAYLDNVRSFAAAVGERLDAIPIDALVLNAGRSGDAAGRTADGFETTFVVNHLAHYLLLRLLLPRLADHARIVLTTSGTHDPARRAPLPPPRHADAQLLAHPELDPDRDRQPRAASGRAYTASKLCVVLTARALAAQPEARARQFTVIAYDPGRTPGTGLRSDARPMARQRHTRRPERRNDPPASDRHQPDSRRLRRLELGLPGPSRPTDLTMAHTRPSFHLGQFCRRAGGVKMQPPTGGTILTAATTGTPSRPEGRPRRETGQHLVRPRTARPLPRPCHSCCGGRPRDPRPVVAARMAGLGDIRAGPYSSRRGLPRS
jgi:NAD(P)-dependent dehydrogenase (short-subunit alcohol dehydrogenase family)